MHILCVGISHKTAPVALRERLAMGADAVADALVELNDAFDGAEFAISSTCNRTEFYVCRPLHGHPRLEEVVGFIADRTGIDAATLAESVYHHDNERAIRHLMTVACGLDSMVLGEAQILGQIKEAYQRAREAGTAGSVLHTLFQATFAVAKKVRTETGIGEGRTSVASVAVDFARHLFRSLDTKTLLVIGAGDMAELTLTHFQEQRPGRILVANRSAQRSQDLAGRFGGEAVAYENLDDHLVDADVVIASTGANEPILTADRCRPLIKKRRFRPLFMVDIAVPRDIEPAVGNLANVYLYDMDDLQRAIADQAAARNGQVAACEALIEPAVAACYASVQTGDLSHLILALRQHLQTIGEAENHRTAARLENAGVDPGQIDALVAEHTHRLINKILHRPLNELKADGPSGQAAMYAAALRRLFDLDIGEDLMQADPEQPRADDPAAS